MAVQTDTTDREMVFDRTFDAPLALVWRLWESRDHVIRWWGAGGIHLH